MKIVVAALVLLTASFSHADSCMELARSLGHGRFHSDAVLKACADASVSCITNACKGNIDCKFESDFVLKAQSCSNRNFILVVPQDQTPKYDRL